MKKNIKNIKTIKKQPKVKVPWSMPPSCIVYATGINNPDVFADYWEQPTNGYSLVNPLGILQNRLGYDVILIKRHNNRKRRKQKEEAQHESSK